VGDVDDFRWNHKTRLHFSAQFYSTAVLSLFSTPDSSIVYACTHISQVQVKLPLINKCQSYRCT